MFRGWRVPTKNGAEFGPALAVECYVWHSVYYIYSRKKGPHNVWRCQKTSAGRPTPCRTYAEYRGVLYETMKEWHAVRVPNHVFNVVVGETRWQIIWPRTLGGGRREVS